MDSITKGGGLIHEMDKFRKRAEAEKLCPRLHTCLHDYQEDI